MKLWLGSISPDIHNEDLQKAINGSLRPFGIDCRKLSRFSNGTSATFCVYDDNRGNEFLRTWTAATINRPRRNAVLDLRTDTRKFRVFLNRAKVSDDDTTPLEIRCGEFESTTGRHENQPTKNREFPLTALACGYLEFGDADRMTFEDHYASNRTGSVAFGRSSLRLELNQDVRGSVYRIEMSYQSVDCVILNPDRADPSVISRHECSR
ncbi:hypothetical protein P152DRAFT_342310 [Eremomyces bilateralis CBS 781.70]|uniref:RdRP-like PH domain-containing protein n=1 Tax=Eremomyces bilateralis CBS 781.70 TaxID=1392243 RepID=A0A6G1G3A8_9PEZI|nr:uncharacterized protein P152DRAFT_342310 [Eremomyces bilateralis CBS 781.70]KAF1812533.1 hypothetical protein P152DRAFT_342310 [Eremomyces bilateralis CBS 781.70]